MISVNNWFYFHKLIFFSKIIIQEYHQSVKKFGSRSGLKVLSDLIWVQTDWKSYQQMAKIAWKELKLGYLNQSLLDSK